MELLKLKIFDVIVNNISIKEFENWLYYSDLLDEKLKENSLAFEVININYRKNNSLKMLKNIALSIFDERDLFVMKIEENCKKIVATNTSENIEKYVLNIVQDYNYDIESNIYWEFYNLHYSFDGYEYTNYTGRSLDKINLRAIEYSKKVLENLKDCRDINDKKQVLLLKIDLKKPKLNTRKVISETRNISFKSKILAFFKKI